MLKILNKSIPETLQTLGYDQSQIESITAYIDKNDRIEGASELDEEHLSVFDCAFEPAEVARSIGERTCG